jgi:hypothetical protein
LPPKNEFPQTESFPNRKRLYRKTTLASSIEISVRAEPPSGNCRYRRQKMDQFQRLMCEKHVKKFTPTGPVGFGTCGSILFYEAQDLWATNFFNRKFHSFGFIVEAIVICLE